MVKPKDKGNQIIIFLSGIFAAILGLFYVLNTVDIIPDGLSPLGYLDDVIILLLIVFFTNRLITRLRGRISANRTAYRELWRSGRLVELFTKPQTWVIVLVLTGVIAYVNWSLDVIPDFVVGLGYADDAIVAIGSFIALLRLYGGKK